MRGKAIKNVFVSYLLSLTSLIWHFCLSIFIVDQHRINTFVKEAWLT